MKPIHLFAGIAAALLMAACNSSVSSSSDTTSSSSGVYGNQVSLSGTAGHAELAGDRIDLKDGIVLVNDVSFGPVPSGANVQYTITPTSRELRVAGELRTAAH